MKNIKSLFYTLIENIRQFYLLKKYKNFNIPIKKKDKWFCKRLIGYNEDTKWKIEKYDSNSMRHFEIYTNYELHFRFIYGTFENLSKEKIKEFQNSTHAHDFFWVLEYVYKYPESFKIPKDSEFEYSKQELNWIKNLQKQCLKDGLKDISYFIDSLNKTSFLNQVFSIAELKKRNIKKIYGKKLNKIYKKYNDDYYITIDNNWKFIIIKK